MPVVDTTSNEITKSTVASSVTTATEPDDDDTDDVYVKHHSTLTLSRQREFDDFTRVFKAIVTPSLRALKMA